MPPTWSSCQCVIRAWEMVVDSEHRTDESRGNHDGMPCPVSMRMREEPLPMR